MRVVGNNVLPTGQQHLGGVGLGGVGAGVGVCVVSFAINVFFRSSALRSRNACLPFFSLSLAVTSPSSLRTSLFELAGRDATLAWPVQHKTKLLANTQLVLGLEGFRKIKRVTF